MDDSCPWSYFEANICFWRGELRQDNVYRANLFSRPDQRYSIISWRLDQRLSNKRSASETSSMRVAQPVSLRSIQANTRLQRMRRDRQALEHYLRLYDNIVWCDICRQQAPNQYYQCSICDYGDYGICPDCFFLGQHCFNITHYLNERVTDLRGRYFSRVRDNGQREAFDV